MHIFYRYDPAQPRDVERWSEKIKHPRDAGLTVWDELDRLKGIYNLHPYDAVAILSHRLSTRDRDSLINSIDHGMGDDKQNIEAGWEGVRAWIEKISKITTDWTKITACIQKKNETFPEFEERFRTTFLRHSGMDGIREANIDAQKPAVLTQTLLSAVTSRLKNALVLATPDWAGATYGDLVGTFTRLDRDMDNDQEVLKVRSLQETALGPTAPPAEEDRRGKDDHRKTGACLYCGKGGHWARDCRKKKRDAARKHSAAPWSMPSTITAMPMMGPLTTGQRFAMLPMDQQEALLNAAAPANYPPPPPHPAGALQQPHF